MPRLEPPRQVSSIRRQTGASRCGRLMSAATNRKRLFTRIQERLQPFALRASKPRRLRERTCSTAFKLGPAAVDLSTPGGSRGERNCDMPPGLDAIIRTRPLGFWLRPSLGLWSDTSPLVPGFEGCMRPAPQCGPLVCGRSGREPNRRVAPANLVHVGAQVFRQHRIVDLEHVLRVLLA
jgi:hypothetical protein